MNPSPTHVGVVAAVAGLLVGLLVGSAMQPLVEVDLIAMPPSGAWQGAGTGCTSCSR